MFHSYTQGNAPEKRNDTMNNFEITFTTTDGQYSWDMSGEFEAASRQEAITDACKQVLQELGDSALALSIDDEDETVGEWLDKQG